MKTGNKDISYLPPGVRLNQKLLSEHSNLFQVESYAYSDDIEERKVETTFLRRPQFKINENSRRRFY